MCVCVCVCACVRVCVCAMITVACECARVCLEGDSGGGREREREVRVEGEAWVTDFQGSSMGLAAVICYEGALPYPDNNQSQCRQVKTASTETDSRDVGM